MSDDDLFLAMDEDQTNLADALDRILYRGAVLQGEIMISVAEIDLLYLDLRLFLSSVDRAMDAGALMTGQDTAPSQGREELE